MGIMYSAPKYYGTRNLSGWQLAGNLTGAAPELTFQRPAGSFGGQLGPRVDGWTSVKPARRRHYWPGRHMSPCRIRAHSSSALPSG
jgi:hypothetical protein